MYQVAGVRLLIQAVSAPDARLLIHIVDEGLVPTLTQVLYHKTGTNLTPINLREIE